MDFNMFDEELVMTLVKMNPEKAKRLVMKEMDRLIAEQQNENEDELTDDEVLDMLEDKVEDAVEEAIIEEAEDLDEDDEDVIPFVGTAYEGVTSTMMSELADSVGGNFRMDYSGRGMYGVECPAITINSRTGNAEIAHSLEELVNEDGSEWNKWSKNTKVSIKKLFRNMDNMGLGYVYY